MQGYIQFANFPGVLCAPVLAGWWYDYHHSYACPLWIYTQHLNNLRQKDPLGGAETTEISVRLRNHSASHFEGSAYTGVSLVGALTFAVLKRPPSAAPAPGGEPAPPPATAAGSPQVSD